MSTNIEHIKTPIADLFVLKRKIIGDERGHFFRIFCKDELNEIGLTKPLVQINFSHAKEKFTTRGFHFQYAPNAETKIVTCIKGEIFDVAVDLRAGSPTFLQWFGTILSEENNQSLFIPEGFAHASQSLSDESSLIYLHTEAYSNINEGGVNVNEPMISVEWPHPPHNLSKRDASFSFLPPNFKGITIS